jgi:NADPH:quinone reductase-like Zn-dependent oxidoreductase
VCSTTNVQFVTSLGADKVVDYTKERFIQNRNRYDIILVTAGTTPYSDCVGALKDNGRLLLVLSGLPEVIRSPWTAVTTRKRVFAGPAAEDSRNLLLIRDLAAAGVFNAVIDRRYPFEEIVAAHAYVDSGRKKGSVVLTVAR